MDVAMGCIVPYPNAKLLILLLLLILHNKEMLFNQLVVAR